MAILDTAISHFNVDIQRARAILGHAQTVPEGMLRQDLHRASWMFGVGALDAYFSDAYADLIARTLRAKELSPGVPIPNRLNHLRIPVVAVIRRNDSWRWRMAARELIEDENVLSLNKIKHLFNHFFVPANKILGKATIEAWILHAHSKKRMFGIDRADYRALQTPASINMAKENAVESMEERMGEIFQRRHDCIHNCDRPKMAPKSMSHAQARKALEDIGFVVGRCHDALYGEFPAYLTRLGFQGTIRNRVLQ